MESLIAGLRRTFERYILLLTGKADTSYHDMRMSSDMINAYRTDPEVVAAFKEYMDRVKAAIMALTNENNGGLLLAVQTHQYVLIRHHGHDILKVDGPVVIAPLRLGNDYDLLLIDDLNISTLKSNVLARYKVDDNKLINLGSYLLKASDQNKVAP